MSQYDTTQTVIQQRPGYIEDIDEALLAKYFGNPLEVGDSYTDPATGETRVLEAGDPLIGQLTGGMVDDPSIFNIPDYVQAGEQRIDPETGEVVDVSLTPGATNIQDAVAATFATEQGRDDFMGRYDPYFFDETDTPRYLPDAASALETGQTNIGKALTDYFPDAKTYLEGGRGSTDAKSIYDTALSGVRDDIGKGTQTFDAKARADSLLSGAQTAVEGGLGQYNVNEENLRKGTGTYNVDESRFDEGRGLMRGAQGEYSQSGGLGQARDALSSAAGGEFGARDAFERGTGRAFELAEQGLGKFDPSSAADAFMDPYQSKVIDSAMERIAREGAKARNQEAARAVGAGAFGGSRAGVQIAETQRAQEEARAGTIANLMSKGYDKSMANAMATDEAARKRALQASGLTGQLGATGASLESRSFEDAAKRGLAAATTSAGLSQTEEQLRQKAFEDGKARGLTGAQLANSVADTMNRLGMSAYESGQKRTMAGEQAISGADQQAYESGQKRQIAAGQELGRLGTTQLGAESQAFESGEDRMLKAADMYRSMGLSSAEAQARAAEDEKKRSLEAGRLTGGLGQTYGQMGAAQADIGQAYGQLAGTAADIGRVYAGMQPADMGFMYELGGKERAYAQQLEDMRRKNVLNTTQQALAPYSYGQTFLTGSPSASMYGEFTSTPQTTPDPFMQGVGMYTNMQGINQLAG